MKTQGLSSSAKGVIASVNVNHEIINPNNLSVKEKFLKIPKRTNTTRTTNFFYS